MGTIRLTAGQALVRFLAAQMSERDGERRRAIAGMWGIFGHGNVCGLGQALAAAPDALQFHQPKNEQAMVHAALGYAKATRRLATFACTASIGPGATNLVTGAATATTNRLPVLLLPGDTFATRRQGSVLQQLQHPSYRDWTVNDCLRPVSRFFDRIARPEQLVDAMPAAMRVLLDPVETGAVTLALHQDVQGEAYDFPAALFEERVWRVDRAPAEPVAVAEAATLLRAARNPLVIAGGGVRYSQAEAALGTFAQRCGLAVAETSAGKGTARHGAVGGIGVNGTGAANVLAREADVVVCVGTRLSDFTTASRSLFEHPDVRFVGINVGAADARALRGAAIVADAREALVALTRMLEDWSTGEPYRARVEQELARWHGAVDADLEPRGGEGLTQGQVLRRLNEAARAGDWVVAAAGSPPGDLLKLWECPPGSSAHLEFAFSCMGHEIPAALGIRLAEPTAGEVVVVIGDGTYLMAPSELLTAVQEGAAITVVLLVNDGYQSIHSLQLATVGRSLGNEFGHPVDYAANARSLGCAAWEVDTIERLDDALSAARAHEGPAVLVCHVEPRRMVLGSGAWWDLGVAETTDLGRKHAERAPLQRFLG